MATQFITGDHDERGRLFAAFDPEARHVEPGIRDSRFSAFLAPFPSQEEAEAALIAAGAVIGQN